MLLTFLYHRINEGKYANSEKLLLEHLNYLTTRYNIVLPGDKLSLFKLNVCLTFDDGFFDFYKIVFPLLKKLNIKALIAVPTKYILKTTTQKDLVRISVPFKDAMRDTVYKTKAPFCSFEELKEMLDSKLVQIASHSYNHVSLIEKDIDLYLEIIESKKILEEKLNTKIDTFVYPFGKFNKNVHKEVKKHYKYAMRLGTAINFSWQNISSIIYRIDSDNLKSKNENFKLKRFISYFWFFFLNTFRKR